MNWLSLRASLAFQFCEEIKAEDYTKEMEGFGWGSIRNLHVHVAGCYKHWLSGFGLKEHSTEAKPVEVTNVKEMRQLFKEIDKLVNRFLDTFEGQRT